MIRLADLLDPDPLGTLARPDFRASTEPWRASAGRLRELDHDPGTGVHAHFVPGRIEIAGKHTDYAGGRSLVAATEQGLYLVTAPRGDTELRLHDLGRRRQAVLDLGGDLPQRPGHWTSYVLAVARRLRRDFSISLEGADLAFTSTLPAAAGMSSSSALVVASWLALTAVNPVDETVAYRREIPDPERLAEYLGAVEAGRPYGGLGGGGGVGTRGGSEDHTAILCSRAGSLLQASYDPIRRERTIPLRDGLVFALAISGVRASKTGSARRAYNRAAELAAELAAIWRRETGRDEPHLGAILASRPEAGSELAGLLDQAATAEREAELRRRFEHFRLESEAIVPAAGDGLARGDWAALGAAIDRSQLLAADLLGNQTPETLDLAAAARRLGALAASGFGAGFGGAVWALVDEIRLDAFLARWSATYRRAFPARAETSSFLSSRPGPGAFALAASDPAPTVDLSNAGL